VEDRSKFDKSDPLFFIFLTSFPFLDFTLWFLMSARAVPR
jgi:hypothetical protein